MKHQIQSIFLITFLVGPSACGYPSLYDDFRDSGAEFNGHHYTLITSENNWYEGDNVCSRGFAHLAVPDSQAEELMLVSMDANAVWLGGRLLSFDGTISWVGGQNTTYTHWALSSKRTPGGCIIEYYGEGLSTNTCAQRLPIICEYP